MFLRFVTGRAVAGMRAREGIFQAAGDLVHDPLADPYAAAQAQELRVWFSAHLVRPERFSRGRADGYGEALTRGLSWFKPEAKAHIERAFALKAVLDGAGYPIALLKARRVGFVVYEDAVQVVAEPFADTPR